MEVSAWKINTCSHFRRRIFIESGLKNLNLSSKLSRTQMSFLR